MEEGFVKGFGVVLVNGWIEGIELSKADEKIQAAAQAKEIAAREGDANITRAEKAAEARRREAQGERDGKKIEAEGEFERLSRVLAAAGGNVDLAIEYLRIDQRKATPGLGTLVESGAKTGTVISLPAQEKSSSS